MAQTVKINGVTYNDVKKFQAPLASDPSKNAVYVDTSDATATAESVKDGEYVYINGEKVEGTMPLNGTGGGTISNKDDTIAIAKGFYSGGGSVKISDTEKDKLIASNIRQNVTILGVKGSMSPTEGLKAQTKTVTPTESEQVVTPDTGYNSLSQVTINRIPSDYITTTDANATADDLKKGVTAYVKGKKVTGTHTDPAFTLANGVLSIV